MRYDSNHHAITIYQDKTVFFKSALPSLFGGLVAIPIFFYLHSRKHIPKMLAFFTSAPLLLWEMLCLSIIYRLIFPQPVVAVNDKGINYQPPSSSWLIALGMTMRWEEMAAIYPSQLTLRAKKRTATYRFLSIMPKDQAMYFQQHKLLRPRDCLFSS
jgi:hypothetical protein